MTIGGIGHIISLIQLLITSVRGLITRVWKLIICWPRLSSLWIWLLSIGVAGLLRVIVRTLGLAIIRSVLTMRIVTALRLSGLLISGTLLSLIIRVHRLIRLWHRVNRLLGRVGRTCKLAWLDRLTWLDGLT